MAHEDRWESPEASPQVFQGDRTYSKDTMLELLAHGTDPPPGESPLGLTFSVNRGTSLTGPARHVGGFPKQFLPAPLCCVPRSACKEARTLVGLAAPMTFTLLCRFAQGFIDLAIIGRFLGTDALTGASLALTVQFTTMGFITMGFGDAVPSLCSQAVGAGNKALIGTWLQLGLLCCTVACVPVLTVWWFTGPLLRLVGVDDHIANLAGTFSRWSILRMWPQCAYYCLKMSLSAQKLVKPDLVVNAVLVPVTWGLNLLFVRGAFGWDGMGLRGAALSNTAARFLVLFGVWLYAYVCGYFKGTWKGWDLRAVCQRARVRRFMKIALPAMLRSTVDLGQVQVVALLATKLGSAAAGTHNTLIQLYAVFGGCWAFSLTDATAVRVGHHLGTGQPLQARTAYKVSVTLSAALGVAVGVALYLARNEVGRMFSHDDAVVHHAAKVVPSMAILIFLTGLCFSTLGALLGQGRMGVVGVTWMVATAAIIPLSYVLAFVAHQHLPGLWRGWLVGYAIIAGCNFLVVGTSNWTKASVAARENSETPYLEEPSVVVDTLHEALLMTGDVPMGIQ